MKNVRVLISLVCVMTAVNFASADNIRGININFVTIGNAGNAADTRAAAHGRGAVDYDYRIGKYEITNAQWNTFTAAAGAPTGFPQSAYDEHAYFTGAQQPTNCISWYEAAQFCNYLTSGDKGKGAYLFKGSYPYPDNFLGIDRVSSISTYGTTYVIPTVDEWHKAAYFKHDGSGYSLYVNGTDTTPSTSQACYDIYSSPWDVGTGTEEQNGTFDMMGNVWEWNENIYSTYYRYLLGGKYNDNGYSLFDYTPAREDRGYGFRIAEIPEPASAILIGAGFLFARLRRKQN